MGPSRNWRSVSSSSSSPPSCSSGPDFIPFPFFYLIANTISMCCLSCAVSSTLRPKTLCLSWVQKEETERKGCSESETDADKRKLPKPRLGTVTHPPGWMAKFFLVEQNHVYFSSCIVDPSKCVEKSLNQQQWFIFSRAIMFCFFKKYFAVLNVAGPSQPNVCKFALLLSVFYLPISICWYGKLVLECICFVKNKNECYLRNFWHIFIASLWERLYSSHV